MVVFWTGNRCQLAGMYESDCPCGRVITLAMGDDFPACAECLEVVSWELIAPTTAHPKRVRG